MPYQEVEKKVGKARKTMSSNNLLSTTLSTMITLNESYRNSTNNTTNIDNQNSETIPIILNTLSCIICVVGFICNLIIAVVIFKRKHMQTPTNWFVFNLAVCDIIIVLFPMPYSVVDQYIEWPFGMIGCKYLVMPTMEMFAGVCVLTHTAISVARYTVLSKIKFNLGFGGRRWTKILICLIWLVCFLILSVTIMGEFELDESTGHKICQLIWSSGDKKKKIYRISVVLLTYVGPMLLTGYSYYKIHNIVDKNFNRIDGYMPYDMLLSRRRKKRQMDRMLTVMYVMFAVTTLPYQMFMLLYDFDQIQSYNGIRETFSLVLNFFYVQILTNPCVLLYMGDEYKKELRKLRIYCCMSRDERRILLQSSVRTTCTEVDRGTLRRRKQPCYDIMVSATGNVSLYNEPLPWNEQFACNMGSRKGSEDGFDYKRSDSVPFTEYTYYDDDGSPFLDRPPSIFSPRRRSSGKVLNSPPRTRFAQDFVNGIPEEGDEIESPYCVDRRRSSAKSYKGILKLSSSEDDVRCNIDRRRSSAKSCKGIADSLSSEDLLRSPYNGERRRSSAKSRKGSTNLLSGEDLVRLHYIGERRRSSEKNNNGIGKILSMEYKENYTKEELNELDEQVSLFSRRRSSIRKNRKNNKKCIKYDDSDNDKPTFSKFGDKMVYPQTKLIKKEFEPNFGALIHASERTEKSPLIKRTLLDRRRNSPSVLNIDIHINTQVVIGKNKMVSKAVSIDENNNNSRTLYTIPELRNSLVFESEDAEGGIYVSKSQRSSIILIYDPDRETIL